MTHPADLQEAWVTRKQLAELMGVSVSTIKNWDREGMPSDTWGLQLRVYQPSVAISWARARAAERALARAPRASRDG